MKAQQQITALRKHKPIVEAPIASAVDLGSSTRIELAKLFVQSPFALGLTMTLRLLRTFS